MCMATSKYHFEFSANFFKVHRKGDGCGYNIMCMFAQIKIAMHIVSVQNIPSVCLMVSYVFHESISPTLQ